MKDFQREKQLLGCLLLCSVTCCLLTLDEEESSQMKTRPDCNWGCRFHKDATKPNAFPQAIALRDVINSWTPFVIPLAAKWARAGTRWRHRLPSFSSWVSFPKLSSLERPHHPISSSTFRAFFTNFNESCKSSTRVVNIGRHNMELKLA